MNKIFDTHSHYNLAPLTDNWREHLAQARSVGVERSVVVGTDTITSVRALELSFYEPDSCRVWVYTLMSLVSRC